MSRQISCLVLIGLLTACGAQSAATPTGSPTMLTVDTGRNKQTVRRLYEEYINQSKGELLPALVASDYVGPDGGRGSAGFAATIDRLRRGIPDIHFEVEDVFGEGDRVAIRWKWSGTHTGTFQGLAPTNRRVVNDGIAVYALRDGKISRVWLQTDRLGFLQQIGVVSPTLGRRPAD